MQAADTDSRSLYTDDVEQLKKEADVSASLKKSHNYHYHHDYIQNEIVVVAISTVDSVITQRSS